MNYNDLRRGWVLCHGAAVYIGYGFAKPPACGCCGLPTRWLKASEYERAERRGMTSEKPVCIACNDTGKNSNGNDCWPCKQHGRGIFAVADVQMGLFSEDKDTSDATLRAVKTRKPLMDIKIDYKITMGDAPVTSPTTKHTDVGGIRPGALSAPRKEPPVSGTTEPGLPASVPTLPPPLVTDAQAAAEMF